MLLKKSVEMLKKGDWRKINGIDTLQTASWQESTIWFQKRAAVSMSSDCLHGLTHKGCDGSSKFRSLIDEIPEGEYRDDAI